MDNRQIAIKLSGVKKRYKLGQIGGGTLQADLQSFWARLRGKDDPNTKIWQNQRLVGESFMALNGIDLTVYKGEALGIIGGNGAGKSTMLKLLSRITAPTEGEIDIYGRISSMLEVGTGFNAQMTGRENIYLNGAILGMTRAEIDAKLEDIIDFSEIREFIDTPVKRYSSGMFVKLAFSVAAHLNSDIIIMDEVLAVGDAAFQKKCLDKMRETVDENGRTVLYVSHNMNTIRELCDRCIVMDKGKIIFDGDTDEAISCYLNLSASEGETDMDLTAKNHVSSGLDSGFRMKRLVLTDKSVPEYRPNETMRMCFTVSNAMTIDNVRLRLTLRSDNDVGIGTAWSDYAAVPAGEDLKLEYSFPLEMLKKGNVYASIGFYRKDESGIQHTLDHISRCFRFRIIPDDKMWRNHIYGFVALPDIKTIKSEDET